jgi:hypothetical protein
MLVSKKDAGATQNWRCDPEQLIWRRTRRITGNHEAFARVKPGKHCATILIEHAANGPVRVLRPLNWKAPCPMQNIEPTGQTRAGTWGLATLALLTAAYLVAVAAL